MRDEWLSADEGGDAGKASLAWAAVLASGDGLRLRPLIREIFGDERPKQFAPLVTAESLLRQTLERTARLVPPERTIVVGCDRQSTWLAQEVGQEPRQKILLQPENRDTAAGVLLPAYWIASLDPGATMAAFPSDHFVLEENAFLAHVGEVIAFVEQEPEWVVLVGARPTAPDPEYGWIEPGVTVGATTAGPITRVERFREKPTLKAAAACLARGWLWSTFVFVAKVTTLISIADVLLPDLHRLLRAVVPFFGSRRETWALREAYARLPRHNFSDVVLEARLPFLAVSTLPPLTWSDLGTPQRLFRTLRTLRSTPAWMRGRVPGSRVRARTL